MRIEHTFSNTTPIRRNITGRYVNAKHCDHEVLISGVGIEPVHLGAGETLDLGEFIRGKHIEIQSTVTGTNLVKLEITQHPLTKTSQNEFTVNTTATIQVGDDNNHLGKVTIGPGDTELLCAVNASRKVLRVNLLSDAVGPVNMGKTGVGAASGGAIEPGVIDYIETTGLLYGYNPNDEAVDVWLMEVNKL